jgi:hypothetical protein
MNEDLLRHLLKLKISLAGKVVERLPESIQKTVKEMEMQLMRVLYDLSKEYVEQVPNGEKTKQADGLKVIDVE